MFWRLDNFRQYRFKGYWCFYISKQFNVIRLRQQTVRPALGSVSDFSCFLSLCFKLLSVYSACIVQGSAVDLGCLNIECEGSLLWLSAFQSSPSLSCKLLPWVPYPGSSVSSNQKDVRLSVGAVAAFVPLWERLQPPSGQNCSKWELSLDCLV